MFDVTMNANGIPRSIDPACPAYKHANMWRIPDFQALSPRLIERERQALQRATWEQCASDLLKADLTDKRGKPIGTIFARWEA